MAQEHNTDTRTHMENLGDAWAVLVGNPQKLMPQIVGTVLKAGGTRGAWHYTAHDKENVLMAWPADQALRAGVIMGGEQGGQLKPCSAMPLMEGLPNDLTVDVVAPWKTGVEANVGVTMIEGQKPLWFYTPTYFRDFEALTPGVTHTFVLAGLAFSLRKALVDDMTITEGAQYEAHAAAWLAANAGKSRIDVPPLKVSLAGKDIIMPGRAYGEYRMRTTVREIKDCSLDKLNIVILTVVFPFENREPLVLPIYVPKPMLKKYEPAVGDSIDMYVWLQGRIIDFDPKEQAQPQQ